MQANHLRASRVLVSLGRVAARRLSSAAGVKAQSLDPSQCSTVPLLEGRKSAESRLPVEIFTIAGVTFSGRQELVRHLRPDQIVYLEREPWNDYDVMAVRVLDLSGRVLGYIARRDGQNARFTYEGAFGLIASAGPIRCSILYGARLYARPQLASLLLDPMVLPINETARLADLQSLFGERWAAIRATTLAAANYRCEVTGITREQLPLELTPQWCHNEHERAVQLTRLVALSAPVAAAKARLEQAITEAAGKDTAAGAAALRDLE